VNIGERQNGRVKGANVIDVPCTFAAISEGIDRALNPRFRSSLQKSRSPYDRYRDGRTSERVKEILKKTVISGDFLKKHFNDVPGR
jgi:hypothetical protein